MPPDAVLLRLSARHRFLGDYSAGVPPLPIPNRAVKPRSADGTAIRWESRSSPSPCEPRRFSKRRGSLCLAPFAVGVRQHIGEDLEVLVLDGVASVYYHDSIWAGGRQLSIG